MTGRPLIAVVDDDESVRESLPDLLRTFGFAAQDFGNASAFLRYAHIDQVRCLLLDVAMPGMTGPELHAELIRLGHRIPTVFMTAHGAAGIRPQLLAQGAVECLSKPFNERDLLAGINLALASA